MRQRVVKTSDARWAPSQSGERIAWVDTAKGLCIVLVVMMHSTLGLGEAVGREGFMHWIVAFARPFRMPDFFLISGLFLARVIDRPWRDYADKRVLHFFYFYVLWTLIQFAVKGWGLSGGDPVELMRLLALALVEPFGTLWFIYLLAVFSAVTKLARTIPPWLLFAAAALLEIAPIHTGSTLVDEFAARYVYFVAGYLFAPRIFALAAEVAKRPAMAVAAVAAWAVVNGTLAFTPSGLGLFPTLAELPLVSLALGLAGAMAVVTIAALLTRARLEGDDFSSRRHPAPAHRSSMIFLRKPVSTFRDHALVAPLRHCGERSIAIYLAFFLPMALARTVLIKLGLVGDVGWAAAAITAFAVLMPLVLERLVRNTALDFIFVRPRPFRLAPASARLAPAE